MTKVVLDEKSRLQLPEAVIEHFKLSPGSELSLELKDNQLVLAVLNRATVKKGQIEVFDVGGQDDIAAAIASQREQRQELLVGLSETSL